MGGGECSPRHKTGTRTTLISSCRTPQPLTEVNGYATLKN